MWELLLQETHEMISRATLQIQKIRTHEGGAVFGDGLDRGLEPRGLGGEARYHRRHEHSCIDTGVAQLAHGAQSLKRWCGARFERSPRFLVHGRNAHVDRAAHASAQFREHLSVADDHGAFRDKSDGSLR